MCRWAGSQAALLPVHCGAGLCAGWQGSGRPPPLMTAGMEHVVCGYGLQGPCGVTHRAGSRYWIGWPAQFLHRHASLVPQASQDGVRVSMTAWCRGAVAAASKSCSLVMALFQKGRPCDLRAGWLHRFSLHSWRVIWAACRSLVCQTAATQSAGQRRGLKEGALVTTSHLQQVIVSEWWS